MKRNRRFGELSPDIPDEDYQLSKRTTVYALQAWQHAGERTLGAAGAGDIIDAAPVVGDSQN
ncbi:hypothetical protein [Paraburkholderia aromaticivorans]|uniref:hypothetical protein n=1 Tax=Paraburkholderia aromaticivorans TaxID=2026199 RepID=UPI001455FF01|nr:hypothetical protein [Paraburkholderia aromaticivorans]